MTVRIGPREVQNSPAPFTRDPVDDVDGLLSATATVAAEQTYAASGSDKDFDGAEVTHKSRGRRVMPRALTISRSAAEGSYTTSGITLVGEVAGVETTETITPPDADGGDVLRGQTLFDDPTEVAVTIPASVDTNGQYQIGVGDIGAPPDGHFRCLRPHADGDVVIEGDDGQHEVIPAKAWQLEPVVFKRVRTHEQVTAAEGVGSTTAVGVTVYQ